MEQPKPVETEEGTWVFFPKRKENPYQHLPAEMLKKYSGFFGQMINLEPNFKLRIWKGKERSIRFYETIITIPETTWELHVYLTGDEDVAWLEEQLAEAERKSEKINEWIGPWSFGDREAIAERYGF